jgi:hypothetical protein
MAERLRRLSDDELGSALAVLAANLAFPEPSPGLAAAVARLVADEPARRRGGFAAWVRDMIPSRGVRRVLVIALLVVALTAIGAGAAYFGIRGIQIVFNNGGPSPTAPGPSSSVTASPIESSSPNPSPTLPGLGDRFELGDPSSLETARAAADFTVAVPPKIPGFGPPLIFLGKDSFVTRVSFVWVRDGPVQAVHSQDRRRRRAGDQRRRERRTRVLAVRQRAPARLRRP